MLGELERGVPLRIEGVVAPALALERAHGLPDILVPRPDEFQLHKSEKQGEERIPERRSRRQASRDRNHRLPEFPREALRLSAGADAQNPCPPFPAVAVRS